MINLQNKVAIITGGSRGMGKTIATLFSDHGAKVVINYAKSKTQADLVVSEIKAKNGEAIAIQADISKPKEITKLYDSTINTFGKIDIVVNNAGVLIMKPISETSELDFDNTFTTNTKSVFFSMKEAAAKMEPNGRIINISSTVTRVMFPNYGMYSASKAAVEQMTRVFAKEIGHKGITANTVAPGPTNTELFKAGKSQELLDRLASLSAFNRIGETEDIAPIVLFLASEDARWITGQNICVNGGLA
ncbi:SDR family oxidoreductase [Formosa sp. A9]|uniref:SDR family oxidoreductase n=1 Tax=Formosa sp. A9 TaxID=3442641 RepID=UPI003EBBF07F